jgi:hypothetical protein
MIVDISVLENLFLPSLIDDSAMDVIVKVLSFFTLDV